MFLALVLTIHIIVCLTLILIILLQSGKGADIGAVFGGGSSQTVFGSAGPGTFLSKLTIAAAVIFMVTSITLTYFSGPTVTTGKSILDGESVPAVPVPGSKGSPVKENAPVAGKTVPAGTEKASSKKPSSSK
jgi:preprotein translocase subunit SecG